MKMKMKMRCYAEVCQGARGAGGGGTSNHLVAQRDVCVYVCVYVYVYM